jgi:Kef-type K+ transport system membrane component KefB
MESQTITTLVLVALAAAISPILAELLKRLRIPGVVIEIVLGIVIGPQVLGLAQQDQVLKGFAELGLTFLMFLAGYEIELGHIKGRPLNLALAGWVMSLALAFAFAFLLATTGTALSTLLIGLCLTTTALGTLLPIVRDAGLLKTRLGPLLMGVGTVGEFGPILAIALLLTGDEPLNTILFLGVFIVVAGSAAAVMLGTKQPQWLDLLHRHLNSSAQLPVRLSVLLVIILVWVASQLGLDALLGAFAGGMVVRLGTSGRDREPVRVKLEAIGFGFLIPIFFVVSGMRFDLITLMTHPTEMIRVPMFLLAFFFVRGFPVILLHRKDLRRGARLALALMAGTQLPLVVVITAIGLETGRMLPVNAAALVGAGMLSVLIFPSLSLILLRRSRFIERERAEQATGSAPPQLAGEGESL